MNKKCSCGQDCIISLNNVDKKIKDLNYCNSCEDIKIKKFSPLKDNLDYEKLDNNYKRCICGKRSIDILMSHILKIMIEEEIVPENATLRRHSPVPLMKVYNSSFNPPFIGKDSVILIHNNFNKKIAERLINEVDEVNGVIKGNPNETVGILNKDSKSKTYELLAGCDMRCDIVRTLLEDGNDLIKILINKNQANTHIEVATTTEPKLTKLYNYLNNSEKYNKNPSEFRVLDAMCGSGAIGIFLLYYGFKEVVFNDIWKEAINNTLINLKANGFDYEIKNEIAYGNNFKVINSAIEDFKEEKFDLCILDFYKNTETKKIEEVAKKLATDIFII